MEFYSQAFRFGLAGRGEKGPHPPSWFPSIACGVKPGTWVDLESYVEKGLRRAIIQAWPPQIRMRRRDSPEPYPQRGVARPLIYATLRSIDVDRPCSAAYRPDRRTVSLINETCSHLEVHRGVKSTTWSCKKARRVVRLDFSIIQGIPSARGKDREVSTTFPSWRVLSDHVLRGHILGGESASADSNRRRPQRPVASFWRQNS